MFGSADVLLAVARRSSRPWRSDARLRVFCQGDVGTADSTPAEVNVAEVAGTLMPQRRGSHVPCRTTPGIMSMSLYPYAPMAPLRRGYTTLRLPRTRKPSRRVRSRALVEVCSQFPCVLPVENARNKFCPFDYKRTCRVKCPRRSLGGIPALLLPARGIAESENRAILAG